MDQALILSTLNVIAQLIPTITDSKIAQSIIDWLIKLLPLIIQEAKDVWPAVQNFITLLSGSSSLTQDQLDQLDQINKMVDAAYQSAVKRMEEEDAAADAADANK